MKGGSPVERQGYRAGAGYRRLPRTIFITVIVSLTVATLGVQFAQWKARRTEYLGLVKRFDELAVRYAERSRADSEVAQLTAEDVPNLEDMARNAASDGDARQAASMKRMAEDKGREAERLQGQARRWAEVEKYYYASMRQRYADAARHPWWVATPPSGDPLDVEAVFLSIRSDDH